MLTYNPVIKNGRFEVSGFGNKFTFSAIESCEAKYKFIKKFGLQYTSETLRSLKVTTIKETVRQNG